MAGHLFLPEVGFTTATNFTRIFKIATLKIRFIITETVLADKEMAQEFRPIGEIGI